MIEPKDIPQNLWLSVERLAYGSGSDLGPKELAAAILNAAIEEGLVSPAAYVVRHKNGHFAGDCQSGPRLCESEEFAMVFGAFLVGSRVEHWKGQK